MSLRSAFLTATALFAVANSHIIMESPVPYSNDKIDNSPISAAQFPCKSQNGFTVTKMNSMKVGEKQQVSFKGTAVHGGGSCQLSYTQDTTPTANSKFKVIQSIEGGCPGLDGSTKKFDFTLPSNIPNGKGTFVWTWFSKMAGQPELYMNCAPIDVTGGASDASKLDALPDMLVANIATSTCKQVENKAIKFPNPGVLVDGGLNDAVAPKGECGASGSASGSGSSPASPGAGTPASGASPAPSSAPPSAPSSGGVAPRPSQPGGVFAPSASSAFPTAAPTTLATSAIVGTASPPTATGSPSTGSPSTGSPSTGNPSTGGSDTCSNNGAIVCKGTTQFGICNNGSVVYQTVAAGTQCANGVISKRGYNGRIARPRAQ